MVKLARCSMLQSIPWDGKPISKPGLYRGIPLADYHRHDLCDAVSVSSSLFRTIIRRSAAHAFDKAPLNPERTQEESEAMALGRFVHKAVAGEPFDDDCVLCPPEVGGKPYNMRLKVWQDWTAEQQAAGKYVITPPLAIRAKGMIIALGKFPLVQQGMLGGSPERPL